MKKLLWALVITLAIYSTGNCQTPEDVMFQKLLKNMEVMENITAEERYDELREKFVEFLVESLNNCKDCEQEYTDTDCENIEEAADIYIDDLREREQK